MYAHEIDNGSTIGYLRAFGPPEVVTLQDVLGNATRVYKTDRFWECIESVTFLLTAAAAVANRRPRLRWFAGENVPFLEVIASNVRAAGGASQFTFAIDVQAAGAASDPAILSPMPRVTMLPNYTLSLDTLLGVVGDTVTGIRLVRQRYQLVDVKDRRGPRHALAPVDEGYRRDALAGGLTG